MKLAGRTQSINFLDMILQQRLYSSILLSLFLLTACQSWKYQRLARLPDLINEASGLTIAAADSCWWLNDSGGQASLYATDLKGRWLDSLMIPHAKNIDWEELTRDTQGYFYLCDFGNNLNARQDLTIYKWKKGMSEAERIDFRYPDQLSFPPLPAQRNFDAEGCFWYRDSLYIFSKNRSVEGNYYTKLYALPDQPGQYVALLKDSLLLGDRVVTGAAINASGTEIALITYDYRPAKFWPLKSSLFWIDAFEETDFLQGRLHRQEIPPTHLGRQYEAIDYLDEHTLLIASEASPITPPFVARLRRRARAGND